MLDINDFYKAKAEGRVRAQYSPDCKLIIFNYTADAQYNKDWDTITLNARGIIFERETGKIIARPFPKFFNIEELDKTLIPDEEFEVYEKLDGSLGIIYWYDSKWNVATRGSFFSDQSIKATEMLAKYDTSKLIEGNTYLTEILFSENRIVVDYGDTEELFLLAAYDSVGHEIDIDSVNVFPVVKKYDYTDLNSIKNLDWKNSEGFVIRFKSGFRMKIKFETYVRLHRIMTDLTPARILEALAEGIPVSNNLEGVPDELFDEITNWETLFKAKYAEVVSQCNTDYKLLGTRKETAMYFLNCKYPGLLFNMLDGKDNTKPIWSVVKKMNLN